MNLVRVNKEAYRIAINIKRKHPRNFMNVFSSLFVFYKKNNYEIPKILNKRSISEIERNVISDCIKAVNSLNNDTLEAVLITSTVKKKLKDCFERRNGKRFKY